MATDMRTTFMDGVRQAAEGTPYVVEETPDGFDVSVDVTEPGWGAMLRQERTRVIFTHHVRMESPETYTITDEQLQLSWEGGGPGGGPRVPSLARAPCGPSDGITPTGGARPMDSSRREGSARWSSSASARRTATI
jgi:hypothetical protein